MIDFSVHCFAEQCLPNFECRASDLRFLDKFVCRFPELCPAFRSVGENLVQTQLEINFE